MYATTTSSTFAGYPKYFIFFFGMKLFKSYIFCLIGAFSYYFLCYASKRFISLCDVFIRSISELTNLTNRDFFLLCTFFFVLIVFIVIGNSLSLMLWLVLVLFRNYLKIAGFLRSFDWVFVSLGQGLAITNEKFLEDLIPTRSVLKILIIYVVQC